MGISKDAPLILGRPFLNTANACIYVASGHIQFHLDGMKETFAFASGKLSFMRNRKERSNPKREELESQSQLRRKSLARISQSQEGHCARRKKHRLHHRRLIL